LKPTLQNLVQRVRSSSKTQACGLTIIGIGMLISTSLAEALDHPALREGAQIGVVVIGVLATAVLFSPFNTDRSTKERSEDAE
jgi:hypothetical protein